MQWAQFKGRVNDNRSHTDATLHTTQGLYREKRVGSLRKYLAQHESKESRVVKVKFAHLVVKFISLIFRG